MLTNIAIKALKPASKPYKKSDGGGLFILVQPNGGKTWRFAYRFDGKQKLLSGGPFPKTTLLDARSWRDMMKHQLALGMPWTYSPRGDAVCPHSPKDVGKCRSVSIC